MIGHPIPEPSGDRRPCPACRSQPSPTTTPATRDEVVLGVDTHKDVHVAAVITALGALLDSRSFPTTTAGYRQLLAWARTFGTLRRAGVECTGSYGAALTRHLQAAGIAVIEVNQPDKATRRRRGKTDTIDAAAAARAVLSGRATATAKTGDGPVEMIRMFKLAKSSAIKSRTQAINQLKAVLVGRRPGAARVADRPEQPRPHPPLRRSCTRARPPTPPRPPPTRCGCWPTGSCSSPSEIDDLNHADHRGDHRPHPQAARPLRRRPGHRRRAADRRRRQPRPAGQRSLLRRPLRRQPGRGVLRQDPAPPPQPRRRPASQLRALHHRPGPPALGPRTRDYLDRRVTEGKTRREAIRCLKRYVAREIYQTIITPRKHVLTPASTG